MFLCYKIQFYSMEFSDETNNVILERKEAIDDYMISNLHQDDSVLDDSVKHLIKAGGKRLRPILFLLSIESFGNNYNDYIPLATGIECLHTTSLMQDNHPIMDDHDKRRNVETIHNKYNSEVSILASNILRSKATSLSTRMNVSSEEMTQIAEGLDSVVENMCKGQRMDLKFENEEIIDEDSYIEMISNKTASIYRFSTEIAGILSGTDEENIANLRGFGENLGIAFQITDDVLDIDGEDIGKELRADLRDNKKTIVTIHTYEAGYPIFSEKYDIDEKIDMIEKAGSIQYARSISSKYLNNSKDSFNKIRFTDEDKSKYIKEIVNSLNSREY